MKIGDRIYVHGYVDEIRKDCVIVRNGGGYFGTVKSEIVEAQQSEDFVNAIRCKGCIHAKCIEQDDDWWECDYDKRVLHGDGFCSWAERKEE